MKSENSLNRIFCLVLIVWLVGAMIDTRSKCSANGRTLAATENAIALSQELLLARSDANAGQKDIGPASARSMPAWVADLTPKGWEIFDKVKDFTAENLYEQINGRAEFFLAYDMIKMTFAIFEYRADKRQAISLSIYDMGTPTNAFGVFSGERSRGAPPLKLGRAGYRSGSGYYIWKGRYYIRIMASDAIDKHQQISMELARKATDSLPDPGGEVWGLSALPQTDLLAESIQYFKVDAMGLDFMRNTYTAQYQKGDARMSVFLSKQDSPESAQDAVAQYAEFAEEYGEGIDPLTIEGVELVSCHMGETYDVVFHKGRLMGGVLSVTDRGPAVRAAVEFWRQLRME